MEKGGGGGGGESIHVECIVFYNVALLHETGIRNGELEKPHVILHFETKYVSFTLLKTKHWERKIFQTLDNR